ncbi:MAG: hypothetical protein KC422_12440 [Trueperaceae bacterium]|nr:hypothetical protein [Trueperaceae bacterium]
MLRLVFILFIGLSFLASAQSAEHSIKVAIPVILQLRIQDAVSADFSVPLEIQETDTGLELSQSKTRLEVLANTSWQLQVKVQAKDLPFRLRASSSQASVDLTAYPQVLARGEATAGWQDLPIYYDLKNQSVLHGQKHYQIEVYYFLSQP